MRYKENNSLRIAFKRIPHEKISLNRPKIRRSRGKSEMAGHRQSEKSDTT